MLFKDCAAFTNWCKKNDGTTIDDAVDLSLIMSLYDLLEYSSNYSKTTKSLWFYSNDKATDFNTNIAKANDLNLLSMKLNY